MLEEGRSVTGRKGPSIRGQLRDQQTVLVEPKKGGFTINQKSPSITKGAVTGGKDSKRDTRGGKGGKESAWVNLDVGALQNTLQRVPAGANQEKSLDTLRQMYGGEMNKSRGPSHTRITSNGETNNESTLDKNSSVLDYQGLKSVRASNPYNIKRAHERKPTGGKSVNPLHGEHLRTEGVNSHSVEPSHVSNCDVFNRSNYHKPVFGSSKYFESMKEEDNKLDGRWRRSRLHFADLEGKVSEAAGKTEEKLSGYPEKSRDLTIRYLEQIKKANELQEEGKRFRAIMKLRGEDLIGGAFNKSRRDFRPSESQDKKPIILQVSASQEKKNPIIANLDIKIQLPSKEHTKSVLSDDFTRPLHTSNQNHFTKMSIFPKLHKDRAVPILAQPPADSLKKMELDSIRAKYSFLERSEDHD